MKDNKFSLTKRLKSFVYAINGIKTLVKEEHNSWIHLIAAGIVIIAAIYFKLNTYEWVAIIISIGVVFTTELVNTAIENIANFLTTENNSKIKIIKDLSAAAVLISALMCLIIGAIIFLPKIVKLA
jgi:diacylglycerol kinase (ATP)